MILWRVFFSQIHCSNPHPLPVLYLKFSRTLVRMMMRMAPTMDRTKRIMKVKAKRTKSILLWESGWGNMITGRSKGRSQSISSKSDGRIPKRVKIHGNQLLTSMGRESVRTHSHLSPILMHKHTPLQSVLLMCSSHILLSPIFSSRSQSQSRRVG